MSQQRPSSCCFTLTSIILLVSWYGNPSSHQLAMAFAPQQSSHFTSAMKTTAVASVSSSNDDVVNDTPKYRTTTTRRAWFQSIAKISMVAAVGPPPAWAAANDDAIRWITGKEPIRPGQKKKSNDVSGTRKDPNFLRSIADCKNQCENAASTGLLAKSKEDCLSECQDICCRTYSQCTFAIVPRI